MASHEVIIEVSARHVHLTQPDVERLFGAGASLTEKRKISQPGQFAAEQKVTLQGPVGELAGVRVVGPTRPYTQVELAVSDARKLGIDAPLRDSGHLASAAPLTLIGPAGSLAVDHAAIVQERHLHMSPSDAKKLGLENGQRVKCDIDGPRGATLEQVLVRVDEHFVMRLHLDTDEGNALGVTSGAKATIQL